MSQVAERERLYGLLGRLPSRSRPISAQLLEEQEYDSFVLEKLVLDLNGIEPVPAYYLRAKQASDKAPVMLYNHAHGGKYEIGKEEILHGRGALQSPPYGEVLTALGISVLCFDSWAFGERNGRSESDIFKEMLWNGQVMWGMMVYDSLRAVDYVTSRADVDPARIGTMGISMGSTMAWWLAALDTRIRLVVDMCCMTDFQELLKEQNVRKHGLYYYVPDLLHHFTTSQINALIAPRPHLCTAGIHDPLTPAAGLDKIDAEMKRVYAGYGEPGAWSLLRYDAGHAETEEMRESIIEFVRQRL
ncbi:alpha/beta hydrolase [Paenibacillus oceani]|uniref:Acetylxylan esterase n=1 Tax=Paenibacillus oceani TaxID=2772510 RepID=A0A927GZ65_9BACL|nr:acetylxylan esterase [Paenibacillus oceani]MBD2862310.1 acetylxylan esterase [Paenibacillus oceani]